MDYTDAVSISNNDVLLRIYVLTNASKSVFPTKYNTWRNCIEMTVKSLAKENKANDEVIKILSNYFKVNSSDITIKSGKKNKEKIIAIKNIQHLIVCKKLKESLHGLSSDS
jgi:uncharacterized protein (TIGR00251 family)